MLGKNYSTETLISNESQALLFSPELKKKGGAKELLCLLGEGAYLFPGGESGNVAGE